VLGDLPDAGGGGKAKFGGDFSVGNCSGALPSQYPKKVEATAQKGGWLGDGDDSEGAIMPARCYEGTERAAGACVSCRTRGGIRVKGSPARVAVSRADCESVVVGGVACEV